MNHYYAQAQERVQAVMYRVFAWMSFALTVTGVTSYYVYSSEWLLSLLLNNSAVLMSLFIAQLVLVFALSFAITKISYTVAFAMFSLYSVLMGMTLSTIFVVYTSGSIAMTFFVAASMFAAMALYGAVTKHDLTSMGSLLFMALIGLIVAGLVNLFLRSAMLDFVTAIIGVVVFAGLTAWDVQKMKRIAASMEPGHQLEGNIALILALQLYLDFINLFISLLRIMGQRKE